MNNLKHVEIESNNSSILKALDSGYISATILHAFIQADHSNNEVQLKWLELNLVILERRIKQGLHIDIEEDSQVTKLKTKHDFYQFCKDNLSNSYALYLHNRHY